MKLLKNKYFLMSLVGAYFAKGFVHKQLDQEDGFFSSKYRSKYMMGVELLGLGTALYMVARTLKIAKR